MKTFEKICENYYTRIYRYILGMTGSKECAEDLTQEVFLIAYKKGEALKSHDKPEAFLYTTAKNLVLAFFRNAKKEVLKESDNHAASDGRDVFDELCQRHEDAVEEKNYKLEVLNHLSEKNLTLYYAYYVQHHSMKEIAKMMGMSEVAVRMKYVRLRKEVRTVVRKLELGEF